jgi:hypothetical protein
MDSHPPEPTSSKSASASLGDGSLRIVRALVIETRVGDAYVGHVAKVLAFADQDHVWLGSLPGSSDAHVAEYLVEGSAAEVANAEASRIAVLHVTRAGRQQDRGGSIRPRAELPRRAGTTCSHSAEVDPRLDSSDHRIRVR